MRRGFEKDHQPGLFAMFANGAILPPANQEAECALLGALMFNNDIVDTISPICGPEDFSDPLLAQVYTRILRMTAKGKMANPITVASFFEGVFIPGEDGEPGTPMRLFLANLAGSGAFLIGADGFATQIKELSTLRKLIAHHVEGIERAIDLSGDGEVEDILAQAESSLFGLTAGDEADSSSASSFGAAWDEVVEDVNAMKEGAPPDGIVLAGYEDMNAILCPMERGDFLLLGGRPSMGKTGVGGKVAVCAAKAGFATEFKSLEMDKKRATRRLLADEIFRQGVTSDFTSLCAGKLTREDYREISEARQKIDKIPLRISAPKSFYVDDLMGWVRKRQRAWQARGQELRLVVIDYLSRMGTRKNMPNPNERVTFISNEIKRVGAETGVTILVLVQLSRGVEQRDDKRPVLSDLRDSGSLEQDADAVVFVYRDQYYLERAVPARASGDKFTEWESEMSAAENRYEIYATKRRDGALSRRKGYYFPSYQAIRDSTYYASGAAYGQGGMDL